MKVSQSKVDADILEAFSGQENEYEKRLLAGQAVSIALEWAMSKPEGFNEGSLSRGEVRQKRRQYRKELREHLKEKLENQNKQVDGVVGFFGIPTVIFLAILSSIISWVTGKILDDWFD